MIRVQKTEAVPDTLLSRGVDATRLLETSYEANPNDFQGRKPKEKFEFDSKIYGAEDVKERLKLDQHNKCAFCEGTFVAYSYGDVEHFRPKSAYFDENAKTLNYPGYYWLAYDWGNLLFSCQRCNQQFKKNHFALLDETHRARNHKDDIEKERPKMINPAEENPSGAITFNKEVCFGTDEEGRGAYTIEILGLQRNRQLVEDRQKCFETIRDLLFFKNVDIENVQQITLIANAFGIPVERTRQWVKANQQSLRNSVKDKSEFAGMIRANFPELLDA